MYRPERFRRVFASKACRKSIMIGTPLSRPQMEKVELFFRLPCPNPLLLLP